GDLQPVCGPIFAVLFVLKQLAERVGLLRVLGPERWAKLVLFLVLARVAAQGSRLSAVRWAAQHAVAETLGLGPFDEDDLYAALDRLAGEQERMEGALYRRTVRQRGGAPPVIFIALAFFSIGGAGPAGKRNRPEGGKETEQHDDSQEKHPKRSERPTRHRSPPVTLGNRHT